jgi:hypothetical protein
MPILAGRGPDDVTTTITAPLILDFLEWLTREPRPYAEVMEFWRTSCPRLTVWEDAVDRGLVIRRRTDERPAVVEVTRLGRRALDRAGRRRPAT